MAKGEVTGEGVSHPWVRQELRLHLEALASENPAQHWQREFEDSLVSGIDEVFHFFFDDHELDANDIGYSLVDEAEVAAIGRLKEALDHLLRVIGDKGDIAYTSHPDWWRVTAAAVEARSLIERVE